MGDPPEKQTFGSFKDLLRSQRGEEAEEDGPEEEKEDGGRGWWPRGGGLPMLDITGLAVGRDGRTVYASEFTQGGLWHSEDAGETWDAVPTDGLATTRIWALALDPERPGRVLAATPSGGLHEWRPSTAPTPAPAGDGAR